MVKDSDEPIPTTSTAKQPTERELQRARALRDNLARRKTQAREREAALDEFAIKVYPKP